MILRWNASGWGRLPWRRLLTAALAAAAIFVYWTQLGAPAIAVTMLKSDAWRVPMA